MKICVVTRGFSNSWGGAERVALSLSKRLSEDGHEVHVVTARADVEPEGLHIHLLRTGKFFSPWKLLSFQRRVRKILKNGNFDIVYGLCQVFPLDIYRAGGGIQRHWMKIQYPSPLFRGIKYATSLVHLAMLWLEDQIFKNGNCKLFVTNSGFIKDQIIEYFHVPGEKIKVVYNGVEHSVFNPGVKRYRREMRDRFGIADEELVLLFVSNNWERKGLKTIVEALSGTGSGRARVVIVGRGKKDRYLSLAREKGVNPDRLVFAGHSGDVSAYYGMADLFVLPSRYEPFSNVCLEAMACGLPVVTTKTNGASELIDEGDDGFVLKDWRDADGLSEIIRNLLDREKRERLGNNAAKKALDFSWERHVEETGKVFEMLQGL